MSKINEKTTVEIEVKTVSWQTGRLRSVRPLPG